MRWIAAQTEVDRSDHTAVDRAGTVVFCLPVPASSSAIRRRLARVRVARTDREEQCLRHDWRNDGIGECQHAHNRRAVHHGGVGASEVTHVRWRIQCAALAVERQARAELLRDRGLRSLCRPDGTNVVKPADESGVPRIL